MILTLHTETTIDSCHQLKGYDGKCKNLHGHTWKIELWFRGDSSLKDKVGILVDFGIVKELKELLDHKNLNEVIDMNPTAENLTEWIHNWIMEKFYSVDWQLTKTERPIKVKVRVYETAVGKETYCEEGDW